MIYCGTKQVARIFFGQRELKGVFAPNRIFRSLDNQVWEPSYKAPEDEQFVPDEHHPVDPMFEDYHGWSIYMRCDARPGDKVLFPAEGTDPYRTGIGWFWPMLVWDFYGQDWPDHLGLYDDTYRLGVAQQVEYGDDIPQQDIEVLNIGEGGGLFPCTRKIQGVNGGAWSVSYRDGWQQGNHILTELYIGDSATDFSFEIGPKSFYQSLNLRNIRLNNQLVSIGTSAFEGCTSLQTIDLRNCSGLETISARAFADCTSLNKIILPRVAEISYDAFLGCTSLDRIVLLAETPPIIPNDIQEPFNGFRGVKTDLTICVPPASVHDYQTAPVWSAYYVKGYQADDFAWEYLG